MRKIIAPCISIGLSLVSGCATAPKNVWVRTDGKPIAGNAALEQQLAVDKTICDGEAQKANLSAGTNYYGGIIVRAIEEGRRTQASAKVGEGCMASKSYVLIPETQAAQAAEDLAATQKERQRVAGAVAKPQAPF